jgi:hypothetical protein
MAEIIAAPVPLCRAAPTMNISWLIPRIVKNIFSVNKLKNKKTKKQKNQKNNRYVKYLIYTTKISQKR